MPSELTLAVMVKNDAVRLERCLKSMQDHVDAILVMDTGSQDNTLEVAKTFGARTHEIEWPNSFSEALNVMLGMVDTDWTLRLDSDEWVDPEQGRAMKALTRNERAAGYTLVRKDLTPRGTVDEVDIPRMWRTSDKIRYEGAVHETLEKKGLAEAWPGKAWMRSEAFLWHDGYLNDSIAEKNLRNVELLKADLQRFPHKLEVEAMLATALFGMKDSDGPASMERLADKFLEANMEVPHPSVAQGMVIYLEALPEQKLNDDRTGRIIAKMVETYPRNPVALFYAGVTERKRGNLDQALQYLLRMESLATSGDYDRSMTIPPQFLGERMWKALGFVATKLGRQDVVQRCQRGMAMVEATRRQA